MASINLIEAFQEFKDAENIDRPTMMKVVEDVFKTLLRKKFGADDNFDVIVNAEKGDLEIIRRRMIVEDGEVMDPLAEIAYTEAAKIEPDFEVGEELYEEVDILDFGRRAILAAKQTLASRISDLKKNVLVKKYGDRIGDIISAEVYQVWKKEVLLLDEEGNELILPKSEQIPQDYFKKGENIRSVVARVDMKNNTPVIILSRTNQVFRRRPTIIPTYKSIDPFCEILNIRTNTKKARAGNRVINGARKAGVYRVYINNIGYIKYGLRIVFKPIWLNRVSLIIDI